MNIKTAISMFLVLSGGEARADVPDGGLVLEVKSAIITLPSDEVIHVDGGVYLDELEAVRLARELAASRQVNSQPSQTPPVVTAIFITAGVCFAGGFLLGFLAR